MHSMLVSQENTHLITKQPKNLSPHYQQNTPTVTPQIRGPVDNSSTYGIPVEFGLPDTTWLCPIYRDPYFHKKSGQSLLCSGSSTQHTTCITVIHKSLFQHSYTEHILKLACFNIVYPAPPQYVPLPGPIHS